MERKYIPETESKLLLLDILEALGEVDELQLLRFVTDGGWMNYITLRLQLGELMDQGQVAVGRGLTGEVYTLTPAGREALEAFRARIPASSRTGVAALAALWRRRFREERSLVAEVTPQAEEWLLQLSLLDGRNELMKLLWLVPTRPTQIEAKWRQLGQAAYDTLLRTLSEAAREGAALPPHCTIETAGEEALLLLGDGETLSAVLSLPDHALAETLATGWPAGRERLLQLLREHL